MTRPPSSFILQDYPGLDPQQRWRPLFLAGELPDNMPRQLERAAASLNVATHELTRLLGLWEMFSALSDDVFLTQMKKTVAAPGVTTLRMSLGRTMIIGTSALFDENIRKSTNVSLRSVANAITDRRFFSFLENFHIQHLDVSEMTRLLKRLTVVHRRMNSGRVAKALASLDRVRHGLIAHYDVEKGAETLLADTQELVLCMVCAARLADLSNRLISGRVYDLPWMRKAAREQALALRRSLEKGAAT